MTGRRIGYAEASTYFPQSSLRDALVYGLRHAPLRVVEKDAREEKLRRLEALASGNPETDVADDWIDYDAAGATGPEDLLVRLREILVIVDLENDVYRLGLRSRMPEGELAELASRILAARDDFRERLIKTQGEHYVEAFDPDRYVVNASVKENLIFGVADPEALDGRLEDHPYMASIIAETGLEPKLVAMGQKMAETLIELFGDLAPNNPLLERMDLMAPEEIDSYRAIRPAGREHKPGGHRRGGPAGAPPPRLRLHRAAASPRAARRRHGGGDRGGARRLSRPKLPEDLKGAIALLPARRRQSGGERAGQRALRTHRRHLRGSRRARERPAARDDGRARPHRSDHRRSASPSTSAAAPSGCRWRSSRSFRLARALIKRPDLLVVNRALAALDANAQDADGDAGAGLLPLAEGGPGFAIFWVLSHPAAGQWFDRVLTFENGRIVKSEVRSAKAEEEPIMEAAK